MMAISYPTSPSSFSMEARVLATSSESRLSTSLGDLAIVGLSSLDEEQQESIIPFLGNEERLQEGESTMPFLDIKEESIVMLVGMGGLELGELIELCDDDVKEIPWPFPIRLPETVYASFSGLITFPWNQLPSRANANVACPAMVVSLCIRLFLPGCRLGLDQEYIRRLPASSVWRILKEFDGRLSGVEVILLLFF
jgi:hypothetical protein